ncbi:hypothetical protein ACLOJK_004924 [Asimina triloba]
METAAAPDTFWIFAVAAKCGGASTSPSLIFFSFLLASAWLAVYFLYWAHPGGPSWGKYYWKNPKPNSKPIPGPRGLPFIGSIFLMARLAHRRLAAAAESTNAKRLMAFSLGETRAIITSHPDVAKEILNSSSFADRPVKESAYSLMFHRAIGFAPYGVYWRTLRRIAAAHLFCPRQIAGAESQRFGLAAQMAESIRGHGGAVRVREILKRASLNSMMCSVFGRKYKLSETNEETEQLSELVEEGYELLGKLNWSDHLPIFSPFDPQKIRFRCSKLVPKVNRFVRTIIEEHRAEGESTGEKRERDFVHVLLGLTGSDTLSESDMIAVLWEMIFRGTDTVAVLIEWILARLVLAPDIQSKVHQELDAVVGKSRLVKESDVAGLVYLQAVVKEVLRLHPPGPLLSWARLSIADTNVDGQHVPAGTTAMVNMWAITRDPDVWARPTSFWPERFLDRDADISVLGSDLRLAPFGSGRRSCPGKALGLTTVNFWVASLMHEFVWAPSVDGVSLAEVLRLSCEMSSPLTVNASPRRSTAV